MLSRRTFRDARPMRSERPRVSASRFIRAIARRIYSAREIPSARASGRLDKSLLGFALHMHEQPGHTSFARWASSELVLLPKLTKAIVFKPRGQS